MLYNDKTKFIMEITMDKKLKRTIIMLVCIVGLVFFSMVLQVLDIPLPFLPSNVKLQFSAILELLGAVAYGPFVGMFIVLAKEFFYYWLTSCSFAELLGNLIPDFIFVTIASIMFIRIKGGAIKKVDRKGETYKKIVTRRKRIMISGFLSTAVSSVISALVTRFIEIPLLPRFTEATSESILAEYTSISFVSDLSTGILFVDLPIVLFEYILATVIVALIFKKISSFMHGRTIS